ncbi:MAG: IS1182 family transposase [Chlorobiaceae bacterium]
MENKPHNRVVFKDYNQNQLMLIPPSLEDLIKPGHPVRVVNDIINRLDLAPLINKYEGGGSSSYHPRMLLKVLVYGYLSNIYSSRKLEAAVMENIHFMWLAGMSQPDHHTINRFRSERLKNSIKDIFRRVVLLLADSGLVSLKEVYTDGTKIEANANKYSFVWGKAIKYNKANMARQLEELWRYTQEVAQEEFSQEIPDFAGIDAEQVSRTIEQINEALKDKPAKKKILQKLNYARRTWPGKLAEYAEKEHILGERNSFSKTDPDATFMRMKEDPMRNGQLKAGYNVQISTNNQFILHFSLHQKPTDTTTLIPHLESFKSQYGQMPDCVTADAGYGSEENYTYLEQSEITGYVKYNYFHKEQHESARKRESILDPNNLHYNEVTDQFSCPMGQPMELVYTRLRTTATGYRQSNKSYRAKNCEGCPLAASCQPKNGKAEVTVNHQLNRLKQQAKTLLLSEEGIRKRKQRTVDVEPVFGQLKQNRNFRRFRLRGLEKVEIEMGLAALAHNLAKIAG